MAAKSSRSSLTLLKSPFVMKLVGVIVGLYALGYVAPMVLDPESAFTGIAVGIAWSLATLMLVISAIIIGGSAVRSALRT